MFEYKVTLNWQKLKIAIQKNKYLDTEYKDLNVSSNFNDDSFLIRLPLLEMSYRYNAQYNKVLQCQTIFLFYAITTRRKGKYSHINANI